VGRWQRFISRFVPRETDLIAEIDAPDSGDALTVRLAVPIQDSAGQTTADVTSINVARGRIHTTEGDRRLSDEARRVIAAIAPSDQSTQRLRRQHIQNSAVTIPEAQLPDALRALRAAASEHQSITETPQARAIKLAERRPLQYEFQVDFADEETLAVTPQIISNDGKVRLNPDSISEDQRWVRQGKTYYPMPAEVNADIQPFVQQPVVLQGDAIPFFLARQLKQLGRAGRVSASDAVKETQVAPDALEPVSIMDLDSEGWLQVDVTYRGAGETFTREEINALPADARYIRRGNKWIPIDRKAESKLGDAFGQIERKFGAHRDEQGRLRVTPGQGDDARRVLIDAAEIDEGAAFQKLLSDLAGFRQIEPLPLPDGLSVTLRPYQVEGFHWLAFLRRYYLNGILADDMGLGKTVQLLTLLQYAKEQPDAPQLDPSLIICPTSCVDNWIDEAAKFTHGLRFARYVGNERTRALASDADVIVTTYETLRRDTELTRRSWDYVILDEAQKIKNPITDTARACRSLLARHRLAVTGTPIENRLDELWALFDFLMPGYLGSQARFRRDYEGPITREKSVGAAEELKRKTAPFILRRMKEQVAKDLPPKLYVSRECRLTREQSRLYEQIAGEGRQQVLEQAKQGGDKLTLTMSLLASLTHLKQICCHPGLLEGDSEHIQLHHRSGKFEVFKETLTERLEIGDKVLVFSQYADMCRIISRYLTEQGISHLYLDGSTRNRQALVRAFQSDPSIKVFVLSLRAAGFGITLTAASTVIHYDRWWNPAVENQATDRAYRIGQKRSVQVIQFRTTDTIEEKIDKMLTSKTQLFGDVIETDLAGKTISRDELLELFTFSPLSESATEEGIPIIPASQIEAVALVEARG
jgi:superfamily II DNA or RNA helicase